MTTQPHPARRSLLRLFLGSGVLLLAACQADSTEAPRPDTTGTPAAATPSASPPTRTATDAGLTAEQRLTLLADTLSSTQADTTIDLPYVYLHLQTWARATNTIIRTDTRRWRQTDGSGREVTRRAPDLKGVDHQPRPDELPLFDHATPTTHRHPPGSLHPYLPEPVPADPAQLAKLLAPAELAGEPAHPRLLAGGVIGLATSQHLHHAQRATALRVFARIPGITYTGTTTDLVGRTGLAFHVTADGSTTVLIIDPTTGELLAAHERISGSITPGLFSYVLILARGHTTDAVTPPADR
ncbi:hypothetical protein ACIBO1_07555 [Micromonospora sp. NPDC049903]|uniref:hypothetical protein n=1 Tax=Micromonospora sp. NPDC049903 TaxID=3364276 RepID=UPI0037A315BF